jgi:hypothetical protein
MNMWNALRRTFNVYNAVSYVVIVTYMFAGIYIYKTSSVFVSQFLICISVRWASLIIVPSRRSKFITILKSTVVVFSWSARRYSVKENTPMSKHHAMNVYTLCRSKIFTCSISMGSLLYQTTNLGHLLSERLSYWCSLHTTLPHARRNSSESNTR